MRSGLFFAFAFLCAAVLATIGAVLVARARGRGPGFPACGRCGYDVSATLGTSARCPECGSAFAEFGVVAPRGRRDPVVLGMGIAILVAVGTCVGAPVVSSVFFVQARQARQEAAAARAAAAAAAAAAANAAPQAPGAQPAPEAPPPQEPQAPPPAADEGEAAGRGADAPAASPPS